MVAVGGSGSCTRPPCSRWSPAQQQGENCGQGAASSPHSSLTSHRGGAQHSTQYSTVQYRQLPTILQPDLTRGRGTAQARQPCPAPGPAQRGEARRPDNHQLCQSSSLDQKVAAGLGWLGWAGWSCARHQPRSCGHLTTSPPHCTGGAWCRM